MRIQECRQRCSTLVNKAFPNSHHHKWCVKTFSGRYMTLNSVPPQCVNKQIWMWYAVPGNFAGSMYTPHLAEQKFTISADHQTKTDSSLLTYTQHQNNQQQNKVACLEGLSEATAACCQQVSDLTLRATAQHSACLKRHNSSQPLRPTKPTLIPQHSIPAPYSPLHPLGSNLRQPFCDDNSSVSVSPRGPAEQVLSSTHIGDVFVLQNRLRSFASYIETC